MHDGRSSAPAIMTFACRDWSFQPDRARMIGFDNFSIEIVRQIKQHHQRFTTQAGAL
jgi:hypothetical protein